MGASIGDLRLWHTKNGIIMGIFSGASMVAGRSCEQVTNPVIVVVNGEGANLMAIYTLTAENVYNIPVDTLIYARSMVPSQRLERAYRSKYMPGELPAMGVGLTTYPSSSS